MLPSIEGEDWGADTEVFAPGDEYSFVFDTPGTYTYYCDFHGTTEVGMIGSVVVPRPTRASPNIPLREMRD